MSNLKIVGAALAVSLWLGGCATQDYVDKHVADAQTQVTAEQAALSDHDARLAALDQTTRDALARAIAAGKLAEGKFLYTMLLSDDTTKFPVDGSTLSPEAVSRLTDFAAKLKADDKNVYLEIQGYTDSTGGPAYNLTLGAARADAVRLELNKQGVPLSRMATISYGLENPVATNRTRAGRALNRRVVIVVLD
jgi:outer membrane protein OmpA-like peptidoglycan-associated protein